MTYITSYGLFLVFTVIAQISKRGKKIPISILLEIYNPFHFQSPTKTGAKERKREKSDEGPYNLIFEQIMNFCFSCLKVRFLVFVNKKLLELAKGSKPPTITEV